MGDNQKTLIEALGTAGHEAFERHKRDRTYGLDDTATVPSPRADMRALARVLATLQHDTPECRRLLKLAGVESISARQCQYLSRDLMAVLDGEEASAVWDTPWNKAPYPSRDDSPPNAGLNTRRLSEVVAENVKWLWEQRIPIGKITLINGDPDLGKTWAMLDVAARITTGRAFPDAPNPFGSRRNVLLVSAEDDDADTLRPRVDILGGDPTRIHSLQFVRDEKQKCILNLGAHLEHLSTWLTHNPLVALVVLDPIAAYLGKVDSHRNSDVRALLSPLAKLAAKHQVAIVGINHLSKDGSDKAIYRSIGSIAFVAAARSSWLVTADPQQKDRRLFTKVKGNLQTTDVGGLAFRIGPDIPSVIMWEPEPLSITADETLRSPDNSSKAPARAEAKAWLRALLKNGPMLAAEIWERAESDRMCEKTVKQAKRELGIRTDKSGGKGAPWVWSLPDE